MGCCRVISGLGSRSVPRSGKRLAVPSPRYVLTYVGGVCKLRCITWCGALLGCLAVKLDSCNNMLSSVHTMSVIHSVTVSVWNYTQIYSFIDLITAWSWFFIGWMLTWLWLGIGLSSVDSLCSQLPIIKLQRDNRCVTEGRQLSSRFINNRMNVVEYLEAGLNGLNIPEIKSNL